MADNDAFAVLIGEPGHEQWADLAGERVFTREGAERIAKEAEQRGEPAHIFRYGVFVRPH